MSDAEQTVLVLAAASVAEALDEVARAFESQSSTTVRINAASSSALAAQIMAGAPGDVFIPASPLWVEELRKSNLVRESRPLLSNTLVLIVPPGNPAGVEGLGGLASEKIERLALAGEKVPAGMYAEQALHALGHYERLAEQNRIARGQDVRVTLSYVERGEAEAGIVYATDARISDEVEVVAEVPASTHEPISYPAVLLDSASSEAAEEFYRFLFSPPAVEIFRKHGFTISAERVDAG